MKTKIITSAMGIFLILAILSCEKNNVIVPSQNITTEYLDITGYTMVEVNDAIELEINFTDTEQPIEVLANENLHQYIEIVKTSEGLKIGFQNDISISGNSKLKVILNTGYLTGYTANDASLISLRDILIEDDVSVYLTGASQMNGNMVIQSLSVDMRDASLLDLNGETGDLSLTASDASRMGGFTFKCLNLLSDLSDASEADLTVNGKINITASGASVLRYKGEAIVESQNLSGASSIVKID